MNRNRRLKGKQLLSAVMGMSLVLGTVPVFGAEDVSNLVKKEETVYVSTDAEGNKKEVIVSNQLKNAGNDKTLTDKTELEDIKNVKGDEEFRKDADTLIWDTRDADIYYQGKTEKELPVSVHFTYFLDGKEMKAEELAGKSGHLQIKIRYENLQKNEVEFQGEKETFYTPFVLLTAMIFPEENFSDLTIDNGKIISDGSKSIVVGMGMPGIQESLDTDQIDFPEELEISAEVKDFTMKPAFTIALSDVLESMDLDSISDMDELKDAFDKLEDAVIELVDGSGKLTDGTSDLKENYAEFHDGVSQLKSGTEELSSGSVQLEEGILAYIAGVDELNQGIQQYLGDGGIVNGKITEYVNGVGTLIDNTQAYAQGAVQLAEGSSAYVQGTQKLAAGAQEMKPLVTGLADIRNGITQVYAVLDGEGTEKDDLKLATDALAGGMAELNRTLNSVDINQMMQTVDGMLATGNELLEGAGKLSAFMESDLTAPIGQMMAAGERLQGELGTIAQSLAGVQAEAQKAMDTAKQSLADAVNGAVDGKNQELQAGAQSAAVQAQDQANAQVAAARAVLEGKIAEASDESVKAALTEAKNALGDVSVSAPEITPVAHVTLPEIPVAIQMPDLTGAVNAMNEMKNAYGTIQKSVQGLSQKELPAMKEKLDSLAAMKGVIKPLPFQILKASVQALNSGAQKLQQGMGALSQNLAVMDQKTAGLPAAGQGMESMLAGFESLGAHDQQLTAGAAKLTENTPALLEGMKTLDAGSAQLTEGVDTLSKTLSSGAQQLAANSGRLSEGASGVKAGSVQLSEAGNTLMNASSMLKDGITQLNEGAQTLKDGMLTFQEEGIDKMTTTVEEDLMSVLDRMDILRSEECRYDTFSGKTEGMDGNVKFIIQTEGVE